MSHSPILSICIPAYNRPLWFSCALEVIANGNNQYESLVEVIIIQNFTGLVS